MAGSAGNGIQRTFLQRRIGWILVLIPVGFLLLGALLGDQGVVKLWRLKDEMKRVEEGNARIEARNQRLEEEINLLRTNRKYLEALARKELGYMKRGEKIYWFPNEAGKVGEETP
jgi:cell division protein FtsB